MSVEWHTVSWWDGSVLEDDKKEIEPFLNH